MKSTMWTGPMTSVGIAISVAALATACADMGGGTNPTISNRALGEAFYAQGMQARSPQEFAATFDRILAPDYIQHDAFAGQGRQGTMQFIASVGESFPDGHPIVRDTFSTEDRVVVRWTFEGTLTGKPFFGVKATGQKVSFDIIDVWAVRDGRLYEHWDQIDWTRALAQLGVKELPAPFVAVAGQPVSR